MLLTADSSIIIASLMKEEKHHGACKKLMDRIFDANHTAIMPYSVLVEVTGVLKRRTGSDEIAEKARTDLQNTATVYFLELTGKRANEAADIAKITGLKGMDAIVVQVARENSAVLITLDNDMAQAAKDIVKVLSVEDI